MHILTIVDNNKEKYDAPLPKWTVGEEGVGEVGVPVGGRGWQW